MSFPKDPSFRNDLRQRGYRLTPQRERILRYFAEIPVGTHLSAEELYQRLLEEEKISLATAYRTLKLLASMGLLRELDFAEGHKHYELNTNQESPHQHIICTSCGLTIEFLGGKLFETGQQIARKYEFEIIDVQFKIFGLCPACQPPPKKR
ncbi:MAG TPA: transcriptional repressor [Cyanobacteria bacterium UBA8530]|nr:transcriptional repressor [Cyanobacteria bacterium UBA8530]